MTLIVERRLSSPARWARRLAVFSAILIIVAGLAHRSGLLETIAFLWIFSLTGMLAIGALILAAVGFSQMWETGAKGGKNATFGTLLAFTVLTPFVASFYMYETHPALNDISTDVSDPPGLAAAARLRRLPMNTISGITQEVAAVQLDAYPEVTGRRYDLPIDRVKAIVNKLIDERGWSILGGDQRLAPERTTTQDVTIEATAHTLVFGFPSDVAIRLTDEETSTYVDMRSASRYGLSDLGDNARRIAAFLDDLDRGVALQAGIAASETPQS